MPKNPGTKNPGSSNFTVSPTEIATVDTKERFSPTAAPGVAGCVNIRLDVFLKEPRGYTFKNGAGSTRPAAALVAIVIDVSFALTPSDGRLREVRGTFTVTAAFALMLLLKTRISDDELRSHEA